MTALEPWFFVKLWCKCQLYSDIIARELRRCQHWFSHLFVKGLFGWNIHYYMKWTGSIFDDIQWLNWTKKQIYIFNIGIFKNVNAHYILSPTFNNGIIIMFAHASMCTRYTDDSRFSSYFKITNRFNEKSNHIFITHDTRESTQIKP